MDRNARWQYDRKQMIAALRDYKAGRMNHLPTPERKATVQYIQARLVSLDELIARAQDA